MCQSGTATGSDPIAGELLAGRSAWKADGTVLNGSMANQGNWNINTTSFPGAGYYSGITNSITASDVCSTKSLYGTTGTAVCQGTSGGTNAAASEVLAGKYYWNSSGTSTVGTMVNRGAWDLTTSFPGAGYYSSVTSAPTASTICSGTTAAGVAGTRNCGLNPTLSYTTGIGLWFKADSLSLSDGDRVATWTDSSSNAVSVTQSTNDNRPLYVSNAVNGKPVVRFNKAASQVLKSGGNNVPGTYFTGTDAATAIFVARTNVGDSDYYDFLGWGDCVNDRFLIGAMSKITPLSGFYFQLGNPSGGTAAAVSTPTGTFSKFNVTSVQRNGSTGYYRTNGTEMATVASWTSTLNNAISSELYVGGAVCNNKFDGDIAEILVFPSAVSASNVTTVECYLGQKYGITVSGCN